MSVSSASMLPRVVGGVFVAVMMCVNTLWMGRATIVLSVGLVAAYLVWLLRATAPMPNAGRIVRPYVAGIAVLCLHASEEFLGGFHEQFPRLFGSAWRARQFIGFNVLWLVIFCLAAVGVVRGLSVAYLIVWFFALVAGIGNGVGHILLSLWQVRYFPGLFTAPLCLAAGLVLVRRLMQHGQDPEDRRT